MMEKKMADNVTNREIAGHAIAGIGQNLVFGLWGSYILIFYTDVFGITAGAAGMIMLFTRLWDAVNDPLMGVVADRTKSRWGRYRPWLMMMALPVAVLLILNFYTPNLSGGAKVAYAAVTYVALSMAFTAVDIPYWSLPAAMTKDSGRRARIFSTSRISTTLTSVLAAVVIIPLVNAIGGQDKARGFFCTAVLFAVFAVIFYLIGFFNVKEHILPEKKKSGGAAEAIKVLSLNRPLQMIILSVLVAMTANGLRNSMLAYYTQYNLNSLTLVSLMTALSIPGMLLGMLLAPSLSAKIGKKKVYIYACIFGTAANLVFYFIGYENRTAVFVMYAVTSISVGFVYVLISAMIADTIEYAEYKTGQRREGLISSTQTFVTKLCIAISGGVIGLMLTTVKYIPNVQQSGSTLSVFHATMTLVPALAFALAIIPMHFYELTEERHAQIVAELEKRRKGEP